MQPVPVRQRSSMSILLAMAAVLLLIAAVGAVVVLAQHRTGDHEEVGPASVDSATESGVACRYVPSTDLPDRRPAQVPTERVTLTGHPHLTLTTNQGAIGVDLAADAAPCTVNSFLTLARSGFYTDTSCHRLTTAVIYVVQCGDPSGSGQGGPGYRFGDENLPTTAKPAYPRGTLAMANGGPGTDGSQFFLVYKDSDSDPNYSVFGTVTSGLDVLDRIAAAGDDGSNGPGDGRPNLQVTITSVG
jgi:peptidyl-prolyl cis-trans isomerase B (cyclophilin B)